MKYPKRPLDAEGRKIPNEGTLSKRVYDLYVAGGNVNEIAAELGKPVSTIGSIIHFFMPRKPKPVRVYQPIAEHPKVDLRPDITDAELDKMIDSLTVALQALTDAADDVYRAVGDKREELLVLRLDRDMEKFFARFDPDGQRDLRKAYEEGRAKIMRNGIPNFYRRQ